MKPLYEQSMVNYVSVTSNDFKIKAEKKNIEELHSQVKDSRPVVAIITSTNEKIENPDEFEKLVESNIEKSKLCISYISGDSCTEFARLIKLNDSTYFRMIKFYSRKRQKLFFSEDDAKTFFTNAMNISEKKSFYLSLMFDANRELNPHFRLARYFGVLETLSSKLKKDDFKGSKDCIRFMLYGDKDKRNPLTLKSEDGIEHQLDPIEIAYVFRNNFYHGSEPKYKKFKNLIDSKLFGTLDSLSNPILNSLQSSCELHLMREITVPNKELW